MIPSSTEGEKEGEEAGIKREMERVVGGVEEGEGGCREGGRGVKGV